MYLPLMMSKSLLEDGLFVSPLIKHLHCMVTVKKLAEVNGMNQQRYIPLSCKPKTKIFGVKIEGADEAEWCHHDIGILS